MLDVGFQMTGGIFLSKSGDTVLEKCWRKQTSLQAEDWFFPSKWEVVIVSKLAKLFTAGR